MSAVEPPSVARTSRLDVQVRGPIMGGLTMLSLRGAFDGETCASWNAAAAVVLAAAAGDVILDVAGVTFTERDTVSKLEQLRHELAVHGRKLVLVNVYDDLRELISRHSAGHRLLP